MTTQHLFDQIAREHHAMIKRIASSHEAQPSLLEDLMQDIYFAIWRALPSFRGDSSLRTFVARIATNRAVTHVARAVKSPASLELHEDIPAPGDNPERQAIALEPRRARLASAVRSLPLAYRQPAMLALEGLTPREMAEVLGITTNAVAIRMSRAKALSSRAHGRRAMTTRDDAYWDELGVAWRAVNPDPDVIGPRPQVTSAPPVVVDPCRADRRTAAQCGWRHPRRVHDLDGLDDRDVELRHPGHCHRGDIGPSRDGGVRAATCQRQ